MDVEHTLIWTKVPILPLPTLIPVSISSRLSPELQSSVTKRLELDGLWGFTGSRDPPPSPLLLPQSLGALSDWGVTMDKIIVSPKGTPEEDEAVRLAGGEVHQFVAARWNETEWETAWFVNPPVSWRLTLRGTLNATPSRDCRVSKDLLTYTFFRRGSRILGRQLLDNRSMIHRRSQLELLPSCMIIDSLAVSVIRIAGRPTSRCPSTPSWPRGLNVGGMHSSYRGQLR